MVKQVIALLILSIVILLTMPYAQQGLNWLVAAHDWISQTLTDVFSGGETGILVKEFIALLTIPIAVGLIPVIIYWLAKRSWFPYFMQFVWVIWLVQTAALVILYKSAA